MAYLWFKAFHIVGVVAWFAGLFYLARLFIYHVEANEEPEPAQSILKKQYALMEKRLLNIITTPAMVLAVGCAIGLLVLQPTLLEETWMHAKLTFVALLLGYHYYCTRLMKQLEVGTCRWSGQQLRGLNEAPTVLLVVVVMLVIFKNSFPTDASVWVIFGMVVSMVATIQLYARKRRLDKEKLLAETVTEPST
jgi:protoporphyrinogen IX oxidase